MKDRRDFLLLAILALLICVFAAALWTVHLRAPWDGVTLATPDEIRAKEHRSAIEVQPRSPAEAAGLRSGDTVFDIDGIDVSDSARLREHLQMPLESRQRTTYVVFRPSGPIRVVVPRRHVADFVPHVGALLSGAALMVLNLSVGFFTHWRRPRDPRARLLNVICIAFAAMSAIPLFIGKVPIGPPFAALIGNLNILTITVPVLIAVVLHFALVFPRERQFVLRHRMLIPAIYAIPLPAYVILTLVKRDEAALVIIATFFVYSIAACAALIAAYRHSGSEEKRQIRWPLWALFVSLGGSVAWSLAFHSNFSGPAGQNHIEFGFNKFEFLIIPIALAIAILKYRLFDIDVIIRRTITYSLLTAIIVALSLSMTAILGRLMVTASGGSNPTVTVISTVIIASLFAPIRKRVQQRVDGHFSRGRLTETEALRQMDSVIKSAADLRSLYADSAAKLQEIFNSRTVVVFGFDSAAATAKAAATLGISDEIAGALALPASSSATNKVMNLDRNEEGLPEADSAALAPTRARLIVPVRSRDELLAVITLGARLSDERYDESDEHLLSGIAAQLALAIDNHRLRAQSATEREWHALDRVARLAFVAASRLDDANVGTVAELVKRIGKAIDAAGASLPDANFDGAVDRLIRSDALTLEHGYVRILKREWLTAGDCSRPLQELASQLRNRIGAYEIVERIAGGGMGEVFRGINIHDGSVAALKLLPPLNSSSDSRRRLEREGAIVSALAHPNIVRLLERGEHDGRLYLAMELLEGETLASRIHSSSWSAVDAIDVATQIASALAALHGAGVVHRDIKPSNIMITSTGRAVLLDFGLARGVTSQTITASSEIVGSLPYMSPEQLRSGRIDGRSDVWSFSVVLYEMLARRRPWRATDPARLAVEIVSSRVDCSTLEGIANPALLSVIREGLEASLDLRIRDGGELHRRLVHACVLAVDQDSSVDSGDVPTLTARKTVPAS